MKMCIQADLDDADALRHMNKNNSERPVCTTHPLAPISTSFLFVFDTEWVMSTCTRAELPRPSRRGRQMMMRVGSSAGRLRCQEFSLGCVPCRRVHVNLQLVSRSAVHADMHACMHAYIHT